jgi:tRNA-dihydrouridine synthase
MLTHFGRDPGMRLARKHVAWYSRGLPGSAEFRAVMMRLLDPEAVVTLVHRFYDPLIAAGISREAAAHAPEPDEALAA